MVGAGHVSGPPAGWVHKHQLDPEGGRPDVCVAALTPPPAPP